MPTEEKQIRFLYSDENLLNSLQEKLKKDKENGIILKKKQLLIDFCSNTPLIHLQNNAVDYFIELLYTYKKKGINSLSSLESFDLLSAIFYMIASQYNFQRKGEVYQLLNDLKLELQIQETESDELSNYSNMYIIILATFYTENTIDRNRIVTYEKVIPDLFDQFKGFIIPDYNILYTIIMTDLQTINRMKKNYLKTKEKSTVGYEDFSDLYATLGKIEFWQQLGLKIDYNKIDEIFLNQFEKHLNYFNF